MIFIDSLQWGWICLPLFLKVMFWAIIIRGLFYIFRCFIRRETALLFCEIFLIVFVIWTLSFIPPSPTTEKLASMYESGEIDKKELEKFLPYAILQDRAENTQRENALRLQKEKNTIEEEEARKKKEERECRKKEAEELLKNFKEEK